MTVAALIKVEQRLALHCTLGLVRPTMRSHTRTQKHTCALGLQWTPEGLWTILQIQCSQLTSMKASSAEAASLRLCATAESDQKATFCPPV